MGVIHVSPLAIVTTLLLLGNTVAHAKTMEEACSFEYSHGGGNYGWRDLGSGFISFYESSGVFGETIVETASGKVIGTNPTSYQRTLYVESCANGRVLIVPVYVCETFDDVNCHGDEIKLSVRKKSDALLDDATSQSTRMTFDDLFQRFKAFSPEATFVDGSGKESCECHTAYPRLRGSKQRYGN